MPELTNFKWPQGEDLNIKLLYKEGSSAKTAKPVDLTGYALRMDIIGGGQVEPLFSYDSEDYPGTLTNGTAGYNIDIYLPRSLSLPGGALYNKGSVQYDIFLRNVATDKQFKLLRGTITFEKSSTLWA